MLVNRNQHFVPNGEAVADGTVPVGVALKRSGAKVAAATAIGSLWAVSDNLFNKLSGVALDTDYSDGDRVHYIIPRDGDHLELVQATGQNVSEGDAVYLNASGQVTLVQGTGASRIGFALEDNETTSATGTLQIEVAKDPAIGA